MKLPNEQNSYYLLDDVSRLRNGFKMDVEFGSRYFFHKTLIFVCRRGGFELDRIETQTFDKFDPDKWRHRTRIVRPRVALKRFNLEKYLINDLPLSPKSIRKHPAKLVITTYPFPCNLI